jgi:hypothetical protein
VGIGVLSPVIKWPGREADLSHPRGADVKNAWSYISTPQYVFMAWYIVKQGVNFVIMVVDSVGITDVLRAV